MKSIYLDSGVISYYTARLSEDPLKLADQLMTHRFWDYMALKKFKVFVSELVEFEIGKGNLEASAKRIDVMKNYPILKVTDEAVELAKIYIKEFNLPTKAKSDAIHISLACLTKIDYLVSWNCKHIANDDVKAKLRAYNLKHGIFLSKIRMPDDMIRGGE